MSLILLKEVATASLIPLPAARLRAGATVSLILLPAAELQKLRAVATVPLILLPTAELQRLRAVATGPRTVLAASCLVVGMGMRPAAAAMRWAAMVAFRLT